MVQSAPETSGVSDRPDLAELKAYVENVLGLTLRLQPWADVKHLPYALRDRYEFFVTEILQGTCLIFKERPQREVSVGDVAKHMQAVRGMGQLDLMIFVTDSLPSYDRKRMIDKGVQFIVPGNQLYLPALGLDLREYFRQRLAKPQVLSPATQSMLIHHLIHRWPAQGVITRLQFERAFSYSKITVSRAIKELADLGIVHRLKHNREPALEFDVSPKETWEMAQEYMRTPFRKTLWLDIVPPVAARTLLMAGETALAEMSLLANPKVPCFAATAEQLDSTRATSPWLEVPPDYAACCVQLWNYKPQAGDTDARCVDPFSLYLSLKDHHDDRVQMCLDEMIEAVKW